MAEIQDLSVTDASNIARFPEGQAPSTVNNGARALEGIVSRWFFDTNYSVVATLSGSVIQMTANRASITLTGTTSNYLADLLMAFTVGGTAITGPCSVNINGIGPISLRDNRGTSLSASAIPSGAKLCIIKDGTNNYFRLLNEFPTSGTWAPVLTCATVGNLTVAYTTQSGKWSLKDRQVTIEFLIVTSTFTHTTAAGAVSITGLPFAPATSNGIGVLIWAGITKANYTSVGIRSVTDSTLSLIASGSAQPEGAVQITDFPTAGTVVLRGTVTYMV